MFIKILKVKILGHWVIQNFPSLWFYYLCLRYKQDYLLSRWEISQGDQIEDFPSSTVYIILSRCSSSNLSFLITSVLRNLTHLSLYSQIFQFLQFFLLCLKEIGFFPLLSSFLNNSYWFYAKIKSKLNIHNQQFQTILVGISLFRLLINFIFRAVLGSQQCWTESRVPIYSVCSHTQPPPLSTSCPRMVHWLHSVNLHCHIIIV